MRTLLLILASTVATVVNACPVQHSQVQVQAFAQPQAACVCEQQQVLVQQQAVVRQQAVATVVEQPPLIIEQPPQVVIQSQPVIEYAPAVQYAQAASVQVVTAPAFVDVNVGRSSFSHPVARRSVQKSVVRQRARGRFVRKEIVRSRGGFDHAVTF